MGTNLKDGIQSNADSASKLEIARKINGIAFDGTSDITIPTNADWGNISNKPSTFPPTTHNHDTEYLRKTEKASDSDKLDGYDSTYFSPNSHNHDSVYSKLGHTHDDRYFTESECNANFLGKNAKSVDSDKLDGIDSTGFARAYSSSYSFGGNQNRITTGQFITMLEGLGAFATTYWVARGSWSYANNQIIDDTGCGFIHLAGSTVEVIGSKSAFTIMIHTPTTSGSGVVNGDFIYVNNGDSYSPKWRRLYNTESQPNFNDLAGLPSTFPPSSHTHDDRYFTESESDNRFLGKSAKASDSDKLDGFDSSYFANSNHNHNGMYVNIGNYENEIMQSKISEELTNSNTKSFKVGKGNAGSTLKDYSTTMKRSVIDLNGIQGSSVKTARGNVYNTLLNVVSSDVAPINVLSQKIVNNENCIYNNVNGTLTVQSVSASWGYVQFEVPVTPYSRYMLDFKFTETTGNMWVAVSSTSTLGVPVIADICYQYSGGNNVFNVGNTNKIYIRFYSNVFINEGNKTVSYTEVNLIKVKGSLGTDICLRSLPHGVKDSYQNGKYIKRVERFYLKDVADWERIESNKTNKAYQYKIPNTPNIVDKTKVLLNSNYYYCISDQTMYNTDQTAVAIGGTSGQLIVACQIGDGQSLKQHLQLYAPDAFVEVETYEEVYDVPNSLICDPGDTIYIGTLNQTVTCTHNVQLSTKSQIDALMDLIKENGYGDIELTNLISKKDYKKGNVGQAFYTLFPDGTCIQWGIYKLNFTGGNSASGYVKYPLAFTGKNSLCVGSVASSTQGGYSEWTCSVLDDTEFQARIEVGKYNRQYLSDVTIQVNWVAIGRVNI